MFPGWAGTCSEQLKALAGKYSAVQEVRGRGLIQGLQLTIPARPIVEEALAEGVLFNSTQDTVLRFLPPFLLQEKHVDKGMRVLKKLLRKKRGSADPSSFARPDGWGRPPLHGLRKTGEPELPLHRSDRGDIHLCRGLRRLRSCPP